MLSAVKGCHSKVSCCAPPPHPTAPSCSSQQHTRLLNVLVTVLLYSSTVVPVFNIFMLKFLFCVFVETDPRAVYLCELCSRGLRNWHKSFTVSHIVCSLPCFHTNHSCSFTFPVLVKCRCRWVFLARPRRDLDVCARVYQSHCGSMLRRAVAANAPAPCRPAWVAHREKRRAESVKKQSEGSRLNVSGEIC